MLALYRLHLAAHRHMSTGACTAWALRCVTDTLIQVLPISLNVWSACSHNSPTLGKCFETAQCIHSVLHTVYLTLGNFNNDLGKLFKTLNLGSNCMYLQCKEVKCETVINSKILLCLILPFMMQFWLKKNRNKFYCRALRIVVFVNWRARGQQGHRAGYPHWPLVAADAGGVGRGTAATDWGHS